VCVDEPDWVSWRWVFGLLVTITIVGLALFDWTSAVWMALPLLVALAAPRLRPGSAVPVDPLVFLLQNVPAAGLGVLVTRDLLEHGAVEPTLLLMTCAFVLAVGLAHSGWVLRRGRGGSAAAAVAVAAWIAALAVSGWLAPVEEVLIVTGALLVVASDLVTTVSPDLREDTWFLPTLAFASLPAVIAMLGLLDGVAVAQSGVLLVTVAVALPVAWTVKRRARREERRRWSVRP
jgi:hypothetical protein